MTGAGPDRATLNPLFMIAGSIRGRPRELHCGPFNRPEHGPHFRFLPRDHYFPGCGSLRTPSTCAEPPPVLDGLRARILCLHRSLRRHETGIDWSKVVIPPGSTFTVAAPLTSDFTTPLSERVFAEGETTVIVRWSVAVNAKKEFADPRLVRIFRFLRKYFSESNLQRTCCWFATV